VALVQRNKEGAVDMKDSNLQDVLETIYCEMSENLSTGGWTPADLQFAWRAGQAIVEDGAVPNGDPDRSRAGWIDFFREILEAGEALWTVRVKWAFFDRFLLAITDGSKKDGPGFSEELEKIADVLQSGIRPPLRSTCQMLRRKARQLRALITEFEARRADLMLEVCPPDVEETTSAS